MPTSKETTGWRATGSYLLRLASKTSLIEETRQFLLTYERVRDIEATRQALVEWWPSPTLASNACDYS